ncbi:MAG: hypothetical protein A2139_14200 [Desulfobacca sp. RBG_16_60_12]|nr:MAG: hypothetical protein A2139_14200 [Desulfobacca sp. RBG_16_60_12]
MVRDLIRRFCNHVLDWAFCSQSQFPTISLGKPAFFNHEKVLDDTASHRGALKQFMENFAAQEGSALSFVALYTSPDGRHESVALSLSSHRQNFFELLSQVGEVIVGQVMADSMKAQAATQEAHERARRN